MPVVHSKMSTISFNIDSLSQENMIFLRQEQESLYKSSIEIPQENLELSQINLKLPQENLELSQENLEQELEDSPENPPVYLC